jgi:MaoC like domain
MNEFAYDAPAIRAWAEFSGDFNPVHFDLDRALALGFAQVPVHGMRVMLDIKSRLFDRIAKPQWLFYKAALRSPVLRDGHYRLLLEKRPSGESYVLVDSLDEHACLTGTMRPACAVQRLVADQNGKDAARFAWHSFEISHAEITSAAARLSTCSPPSREPWLLLDALLFSKLLADRELFLRAAGQMSTCDIASAAELMEQAVVLQTHHSTLVSEAIQRLPLSHDGGLAGVDTIHCHIRTPVIDGNIKDGFVAEVSLDARTNDTFLLSTTVGLRISF